MNYFRFIKALAILSMSNGLLMACAARLEPAFVTGLSFAKQPVPAPVVATPLLPQTLPTLRTRTTGLERQVELETQAEHDVSLERELQFRLYSVFFETDKANLRATGMQQINEFVEIIQQYQPSTVFIEGHTDNRGGQAYNQALSERRANTVRNALISKGVAPEILVVKGFGENEPAATNTTRQGQQQNRRVELIVPNEARVSGIQ